MTEPSRLLMGILLAAVLAISITWYDRRAFGPHARQKGPDYAYSLPPVLLVDWVLQPLGAVILNRRGRLPDAAFSLCFSLFLQLSLYNLILLALLPLLRRCFKPQTCALLWLLPACLYLLQYDTMAPTRPRVILQVPDLPIKAILLVWGAVFAAVLGWKILSHFRFCRAILTEARPADDPAVLDLWSELQARPAAYRQSAGRRGCLRAGHDLRLCLPGL